MEIEAFYRSVGGNYGDVIARLGSESMIRRFLAKFMQDPSFATLETAWEAGDVATAFRGAHTLKGVAATLGLTRLAETSSALTEQLRPLAGFPERHNLDVVREEYRQAVDAIAQLTSGN